MSCAMRFMGRTKPCARLAVSGFATLAWFTLTGCGGAAQSASGPRAVAPVTSGAPRAVTAPASPLGVSTSAAAPPAPVVAQRLPEIALDPKQPIRSLPELKVENIGLHVGGGPNDAETKAPFLRAIAERFPEFMDCYRQIEDPAKGGRFGIDMHIARSGGHARVEQPRTALHGPAFRACVSTVFESVEFQKPTRGPTTISYSLRFTMGEAL
jgi:hypothetical protein